MVPSAPPDRRLSTAQFRSNRDHLEPSGRGASQLVQFRDAWGSHPSRWQRPATRRIHKRPFKVEADTRSALARLSVRPLPCVSQQIARRLWPQRRQEAGRPGSCRIARHGVRRSPDVQINEAWGEVVAVRIDRPRAWRGAAADRDDAALRNLHCPAGDPTGRDQFRMGQPEVGHRVKKASPAGIEPALSARKAGVLAIGRWGRASLTISFVSILQRRGADAASPSVQVLTCVRPRP